MDVSKELKKEDQLGRAAEVDGGRFKCQVCGCICVDFDTLKFHMNTKHNERYYIH